MSDRTVFVIGVTHAYQLYGFKTSLCAELFAPFLHDLCISHDFDLLAEELNQEAIDMWAADGARDSTARVVAERLGISHMFCDPERLERTRIGIKSQQEIESDLGIGKAKRPDQDAIVEKQKMLYWPLREEYWIGVLSKANFKKALLIVGVQHVDNISVRLKDSGFKTCRVAEQRFKVAN